jgi:hypothetical protein
MNWPALFLGIGVAIIVVVGGYLIAGRFVASSDERALRRQYTALAAKAIADAQAAQTAYMAEHGKGIAAEASNKYPIPAAPSFLYT